MAVGEEEKAKSQEGPEAAEPTAPEVEAEIVDVEPDVDEAGVRETPPEGAPERRGLTARFSPGVLIFFGFILVSVAAFALWRWQTSGDRAPGMATPEGAATGVQDPIEPAIGSTGGEALPPRPAGRESSEPAQAGPQGQHTEDDLAEPDGEEAAGAAVSPTPDKITNEIDSSLKRDSAADALLNSEGRGLPPAPASGSANTDLQQAAKDFMRRASPDEDAGDSIDAAPPAADAPAIEFQPVDRGGETGDEAEDESGEEATAPAPEETAAAAAAVETLEAALEQEIRRAETLTQEIERLKEEFRLAQRERDDRAAQEARTLRAEIEELRSALRASNSERPAAILTMISLSQSVDEGEPYAPALEAIRRQAPGLGVSEAIESAAEGGVPTLADLKSAFPPTARAAIVAAAKEDARGPAAQLFAEFQNIVTVRPAAPEEGGAAPAIISRAEHHLERDRLADAAAEIRSLEGAAAAAFERWLADADKTLQVRADLRRMRAELHDAMTDRADPL